MRTQWNRYSTTAQVSTERKGTPEEEKAMARRKLSIEDQLKGVRAALRSKRTPPQFQKGLRDRERELQKMLARRGKRRG